MQIALITDQHFGGKQDSQSFSDYIEMNADDYILKMSEPGVGTFVKVDIKRANEYELIGDFA